MVQGSKRVRVLQVIRFSGVWLGGFHVGLRGRKRLNLEPLRFAVTFDA